MSQIDTRERTQKGYLESGGLSGALTGAFLGGSQEAAKGYDNVSTLRGKEQAMRITEDQNIRSEESHSVDLMSKYLDLQAKSKDIQITDMGIEVLKAGQKGRVDTASKESKLASDMLAQYSTLSKTQANKTTLESIEFTKALDDQQRGIVANLGEGVTDAATHKRAYNRLASIAESQGKAVEEMFPGMEEKWHPEETPKAYRFARRVATASQKVMETERLDVKRNNLQMTRDEKAQEYKLESLQKQFEYDLILQANRNKASFEEAKLKAVTERGEAIKRTDYDNMPTAEAAGIANVSITAVMDSLRTFMPSDEKMGMWTNDVATKAQERFDKDFKAYKTSGDPAMAPASIHTYIEEEVGSFVGRIDNSGNVRLPGNEELVKDKTNWTNNWVHQANTNPSGPYADFTQAELRFLAENAWEDPQERMKGK